MKKFTKQELIGTIFIFLLLIGISLPNFVASLRRARDVTRKEDLRSVVAGLDRYAKDYGEFPMSQDGKILACIKSPESIIQDKEGKYIVKYIPCQWGVDPLADFTVEGKNYVDRLPQDPQFAKTGGNYYYVSNGRRYQVYASLEGKKEAEYDLKIINRDLPCGTKVCNMGRAFGNTPLDISLEEYEDLIRENE